MSNYSSGIEQDARLSLPMTEDAERNGTRRSSWLSHQLDGPQLPVGQRGDDAASFGADASGFVNW